MAVEYSVRTSDVVNVQITNSSSEFATEKRFSKTLTVSDLKARLELVTGLEMTTMEIQVFDNHDKLIAKLTDDSALLGSYPVDDGMRFHVIDEAYSKRNDTVRAFMLRNKMGKYAELTPEELAEIEINKLKIQDEEDNLIQNMEVGARCEVRLPNQPPKRGEVMYIGKPHFKPGYWIGVKYDEPLGKNDGSVEGKRYFECPPKYGAFMKPQQVTVGDFPEEDLDDEM